MKPSVPLVGKPFQPMAVPLMGNQFHPGTFQPRTFQPRAFQSSARSMIIDIGHSSPLQSREDRRWEAFAQNLNNFRLMVQITFIAFLVMFILLVNNGVFSAVYTERTETEYVVVTTLNQTGVEA